MMFLFFLYILPILIVSVGMYFDFGKEELGKVTIVTYLDVIKVATLILCPIINGFITLMFIFILFGRIGKLLDTPIRKNKP